ncbi:TIGR02594 family protein [Methylopila sp. 73B]|uniref:TIGR02594 family protein n=1 Tax=Methylopila sp. 73B TaxID=1120792 RepID=UPI0003732C9A|nr:TIGR02594 family protein [Methylopila sp. 73B]
MATEEQRLLVLVDARIDGLEKQLKKAAVTSQRGFREVGDHAANARKRIEGDTRAAAENANRALATIGAKGIDFGKGFAAGALAGGLAAVTAAAKTAISSVAELKREAEKAGVGTAAFQELSFAARQSGVSIDALTDGLKELNIRGDEFALNGGGSGAEAFKRLRYTSEELGRKLKDPAALFVEIIGRIKQLDTASRIRVSDEIFGGTGGEQFVRFLDQGAAGITRLREEARATGVVIKDDVVDKAVELDRKFQKLVDIVSGNFKSGVVEIAGYIEDWASGVGSFISMLEGGLASIGNSVVFRKLNDWFGGDPAAAGLTMIPQGEGADVGRAVGSRFATAIGALDKLGKSAREASGKLDDITLPPQGMPVGSASGSIYETAKRYSGLTERANDGEIRSLLSKTGQTFSGELREWCADFVNAILAERGIKGTGSRAARSFLSYGEETTKPQAGDIVILKRGSGGQGHVGFFEGYDDRGRVKVLGGNQSEGVNTQAYDADRVLGFRRQPQAGDDVTVRLNTEKTARTQAEQAADRQAEAVKRVTEALGLEADQLGKTEQEQKTLQALQQAGVDLHSKEGQAIAAKVAELYRLKAAQDLVDKKREAGEQRLQELTRTRRELEGIGLNATQGLVADLTAGVSAADAFGSALKRVADQLLEMIVQRLFQNAFAMPQGQTGAGGGFLGFLSNLLTFSDGGFTGDGGKYEPAGIVHRGEYVVSKEATRRIGVDNLERLHRSAKGYADGGIVGAPSFVPAALPALPTPIMPRPIAPAGAAAPTSNVITMAPSITVNASGGTLEENDDLAKRIGAEVEGQMRGLVNSELLKSLRPGGLLDTARRRY